MKSDAKNMTPFIAELVNELSKRGGKGSFLSNTNVYEVTLSDRTFHFIEELTPLIPYTCGILFSNKRYLRQVLYEDGINIPQGMAFSPSSLKGALNFLEELKSPVTISLDNIPTRSQIYPYITQKDSFISAFEDLMHYREVIIIEKYTSGDTYKVFITKDGFHNILKRHHPFIKGDQTSSIKQLIAKENIRRFNSSFKQILNIHPDMLAPYTWQTILNNNQKLIFPLNINDANSFEDVTEQAPKIIYSIASKVLGLFPNLGYLSLDIKLSPKNNNYTVLNLYLTPGENTNYPVKKKAQKKSVTETLVNQLLH